MSNFNEWLDKKEPTPLPEVITETSGNARYSIEVNYRTSMEEAVDNFAKLCLGYVSAAIKNCGFHVKNIYDKKPYRIIISTRNWDDGEWVGLVLFQEKEQCFIIAKGHYNKEKKTVSLQGSHKSTCKSAAEIAKEMRTYMDKLKHDKPRGSDNLEPVKRKPGPKPRFLQSISKVQLPFKPYNPY